MTDPAKDYAWAALRPDGRVDNRYLGNYQSEVREGVITQWREATWKAAYRDGWRVVRVELRRV